VDLVRLAHYPFMPEVPATVRELGPPLSEVLTGTNYDGVRARALNRLRGAMEAGIEAPQITDDHGALRELLSIPVARMLAVHLRDKILQRRYAESEGRLVARTLNTDSAALEEAAEALGVQVRLEEHWRIHVTEYLRIVPVQQTEWKLIRRPIAAGYVILDNIEVANILGLAYAQRIQADLDRESSRPLPADLIALLDALAAPLLPALEEAKERWNTGDFGPVQPGLFPPCISDLFAMMAAGQNIPHHGRFAFASFMGTIGMNAEQIMDYLSSTPNFDREKSRYQIEHITGERGVEKYTPPGCQSMQTNGICPLEKRDGLCLKIKHPLSYYRAKLRFQKDDAKADEPNQPPAAPGATPSAGAA